MANLPPEAHDEIHQVAEHGTRTDAEDDKPKEVDSVQQKGLCAALARFRKWSKRAPERSPASKAVYDQVGKRQKRLPSAMHVAVRFD